VAQAQVLVDLAGVAGGVVERERRRLGLREHREAAGHDLDVAGREPIAALPSGRRRTVPSTSTTHSFRSACGAKAPRRVGFDHDLGHALAVAEVEEDEAAEVAAAVDPALQDDGLALVLGAQGAAGVRTSHGQSSQGRAGRGRIGPVGSGAVRTLGQATASRAAPALACRSRGA
jgi:hypothetical protein